MSNKACVPDVDIVVLAGGKGSRPLRAGFMKIWAFASSTSQSKN